MTFDTTVKLAVLYALQIHAAYFLNVRFGKVLNSRNDLMLEVKPNRY